MTQHESPPPPLLTPGPADPLLRALLDGGGAFVLLADPDGASLPHAPHPWGALGYGSADAPDDLWAVLHPDDALALRPLLARPAVLDPAGTATALPPFRLRHADGGWRWMEGTLSDRRDDPALGGLVLHATDVTDRQRHARRDRGFVQLARALVGAATVAAAVDAIVREAVPELGALWGEVDLSPDATPGDAGEATDGEGRLALPLRARGRALGALRLRYPAPREFGAADRQFLADVASLCADALDRARLAEQEAGYGLLARYSADVTTVLAPDGTILFDTEIATRLLGYPLDELVGHSCLKYIHPDDRPAVTAAIGRAGGTPGLAVEVTYRFRHGDGRWIWLESVGADHSDDPHVGGILVNSRDVTERVAAKRALETSERRFRLLAENADNVIATYAPDGTCTYCSPASRHVTGHAPDEYGRLPLEERVHPDDLDRVTRAHAAAWLPTFTQGVCAYRALRKDGTFRWVETTIKTVRSPATGALLELQTSTADIHERRAAEERLQAQVERSQQLVALTVALEGQFDPASMAREALDRCLRVTEYTVGCYVELDGDGLALRHASGADEALVEALARSFDSVGALGDAGAAVRAGEAYHGAVIPALLPAPARAALSTYRRMCALPVVAHGEAQGAFLLLTAERIVSPESLRLLRAVAERVGAALERTRHVRQLDASREETLRALGLALEYRDFETKGHTDRVVALSERLGRALGVGGPDLDALRWGAYLHDTGKIAVPDAVLLKPDRLDGDEWTVMKRHTSVGFAMLSHIPNLPPATLEVVLHHHEKWDGSGYPAGLAGESIPLLVRVFAVVDVFDALTSDRPYRPAWSVERALEYLQQEAGRQFDPRVVRAFVGLLREVSAA